MKNGQRHADGALICQRTSGQGDGGHPYRAARRRFKFHKRARTALHVIEIIRDNIGFLKSGRIPCAVFQSRDCRRNRANNEPSSPRCLIVTTIITPDTTAADSAACVKT